jgi:hypothetical protein
MCTADGGGSGLESVAEALRMGDAVADYLNSPAAGELDGAACGEALVSLGRVLSRLTAAQAGHLRRSSSAARSGHAPPAPEHCAPHSLA